MHPVVAGPPWHALLNVREVRPPLGLLAQLCHCARHVRVRSHVSHHPPAWVCDVGDGEG